MSRKVSLTGIKPTGDLHIGNYLAAIREGLKLCEQFDCIYFIADLHALTTVRDPKAFRRNSYEVTAAWLAFGFDAEKHIMFRQSDLPLVTEYAWYLSCFTGVGLLNKAHAFKDAQAKNKDVNHGLYAYPVLMAADIMMYDADVVPVGKDQKQHVELARDMAGAVNALYGAETIKLPEPLINEDVMVIPGLDGQKMSKSYNNTIPLFCSDKELKKRVLSLVTDSTPLEEPKELRGSTLGELFAHFATEDEFEELRQKLAAGNYGWGHAKMDLFEAIMREIGEARKRFKELIADEKFLDSVLESGLQRAWERAKPVLNRLRNALGLADTSIALQRGLSSE